MDEAGAPIVSICGGEPMIYPEIGALVHGILKRRKHIYLCTNGMFIKKKLHEFRPTSRFFFNVHLDGLEETHDLAVEREGVFKAAVEGIMAAKKAGFLVCTNTTIYKETDLGEIDRLFAYLTKLGVDGFMLSPAYGYTAVQETNPDGAAEIFMTRDDIRAKFQEAEKLLKQVPHDVVADLPGVPQRQARADLHRLGQPDAQRQGLEGAVLPHHRRAPRDLRRPDGRHDWENYGHGKDPRCEHCMMHCGYEPSAALGVNAQLGDSLKMLMWQLS